jgi:hypothetical protein
MHCEILDRFDRYALERYNHPKCESMANHPPYRYLYNKAKSLAGKDAEVEE